MPVTRPVIFFTNVDYDEYPLLRKRSADHTSYPRLTGERSLLILCARIRTHAHHRSVIRVRLKAHKEQMDGLQPKRNTHKGIIATTPPPSIATA